MLERYPNLAEVAFEAQNRTFDPVEATTTDERIKVSTDPRPPYGRIGLTMRRGVAAARWSRGRAHPLVSDALGSTGAGGVATVSQKSFHVRRGMDVTAPGSAVSRAGASRPHFRGLDHVGFAVGDLDRSIAFYEVLLGVPLLLRKTWDVPYTGDIVGYAGVVMDGAFFQLPNGVILELLRYRNYGPGVVDMESWNAGNAHLCLVTDDMDAGLRSDASRRVRHLPVSGAGRHPVGSLQGWSGLLPAPIPMASPSSSWKRPRVAPTGACDPSASAFIKGGRSRSHAATLAPHRPGGGATDARGSYTVGRSAVSGARVRIARSVAAAGPQRIVRPRSCRG